MTIESMLWPNTGIGDGDILGYSAVRTQTMFAKISNQGSSNLGVYMGYEQECLCEVTDLNEVTVRDGAALVGGIFCTVEEEAVVVSSEASATGFTIIIDLNLVAQTGSLAVLKAAVGTVEPLSNLSSGQLPLCGGVIETDGTITRAYSINETTTGRYAGLLDLRRFVGDTAGDRVIDWCVGASTSSTGSIAILHPFIPQCYDDLQVRLCITTGTNTIGLGFNRNNENFNYRYSSFRMAKTSSSGAVAVGIGGSVSSAVPVSDIGILTSGAGTINGELFFIINIYGYNKLGQSKRGDWLCYGDRTIARGEFTWGSDWSINDIYLTGSQITINSSVLLGVRR